PLVLLGLSQTFAMSLPGLPSGHLSPLCQIFSPGYWIEVRVSLKPGSPDTNRPTVACLPVSRLFCGSTWMRPSVWVWMPMSVGGCCRLGLTVPQMSIEYAVCQWSFTVGGSAAALLTLERLMTMSNVPTTTTTNRLEYQPHGVRPRAV